MKSASFYAALLIGVLVLLSGSIVWLMSPTRDVLPVVTQSAAVIVTPTSTISAATSTPAYSFDPTSAHPGAIVAGWMLEVIGPVSGTAASTSSFQNVHAQFSGTSTVTGVYDYSMNELFGKELICMTVSEPSECAKLPSIQTSCTEPRRFCFMHPELLRKQFGGVYGSGKATVQIKSYQMNYAPTEVFDTAELVKVLDRF